MVGGVLTLAIVLVVPSIASSVAVFGPRTAPWWTVATLAATAAAVAWLGITVVRGDDPSRPARGFLALCVLVLLTYSFVGHPDPGESRPWVVHLVPQAIGATAVAWRGWGGLGPGVALIVGYSWLRTTPAWGGIGDAAVVGTLFSVVTLVAAIVAVGTVRVAADRVSTAAAVAADARTRADAAVAELRERARWEAMVHDDVLAALQTASAATTPHEWQQAAVVARGALLGIERSPRGSAAEPVEFVRRAAEAVHAVHPEAVVHVEVVDGAVTVPSAVADALLDATAEAVRNARRHARRGRAAALVQVSGEVRHEGVGVVIRDDGQGFDVERVPPERLGLRVSVRQRMQAVGGSASWTSTPGAGTQVVLQWRP